jgi:hypothetical protein
LAGKLREEDNEFKAGLGNTARPHLKKKKNSTNKVIWH